MGLINSLLYCLISEIEKTSQTLPKKGIISTKVKHFQ